MRKLLSTFSNSFFTRFRDVIALSMVVSELDSSSCMCEICFSNGRVLKLLEKSLLNISNSI